MFKNDFFVKRWSDSRNQSGFGYSEIRNGRKPLEIYRDYPDNEAGDIRLASGMIFREMQLLNVLIIFLLTVVTVHAQRGYIHNGTALTFLVNSGRIPVLFWKMPVCVMLLVLCLLLLAVCSLQ